MTARGDIDSGAVSSVKDAWRRRLLAARRALPATERGSRAAALSVGVLRLAAGLSGPICAYLPIGTEPGSPAMLDALRGAAHEVLLPVVPEVPGPLDWARYDGSLESGPLGLLQPTGSRLGPGAITGAALVLVPALAADRSGQRLGRGGGFYDRTLHLAAPGTPLVVLLNDDELVNELPAEPHDRPVTAALLAEAGLTTLGNSS